MSIDMPFARLNMFTALIAHSVFLWVRIVFLLKPK
jgi:hypothetical protein